VKPPKLQMKLKTGIDSARLEEVMQAAQKAGAVSVRPLLPGSTDEELASLFIIDAKSASVVPKLLKLMDLDSVEFVEPEVTRTLKGTGRK
jgi:hypothetical protein